VPTRLSMAATSNWLCPTELDRERLIGSVRLVRGARAAMFVLITVVALASAPKYGLWPLIPIGVAAIVSSYLYRGLEHRRRPEYWAVGGWLFTQVPLAIGIGISGGAHSPALPWLAISVVSLVARFSHNAIRAGMAFLFVLLAALTIGVDPGGLVQHPWLFVIPAALLFSVWVFAQALLRQDLQHRDYDKLTGLANNATFTERLRLVVTRHQRVGGALAVLAVDLEGFALANETLGPSVGDDLLRQAASRLARTAAAAGAELIARRSADEFLILLADLHPSRGTRPPVGPWLDTRQTAEEVARSLQAALAEPLQANGRPIYLGASIGISILLAEERVGDPTGTSERLLAQAQQALSTARAAGQGSILHFDVEHPDARRRLSLITRLRQAVDREDFLLYYQPTVNLHTREITGVEALLRWDDPERDGVVAPGEFIDVAEQTGLIEPIGEWVLHEVARQARIWEERQLDLEVAFNLSPRQLWQPELVPTMLAILATADVGPERLLVEITESSALRDPERTYALLRDITQRGFRLAIDDFGVGLSSLSRLRTLPADVLKIDRSFIADITRTPQGPVMVQTVVQLARNLGMEPHAEGIEHEDELRFLLEHGCTQGQGNLFARPCPPDAIEALYLQSLASRVVALPGKAGLPA